MKTLLREAWFVITIPFLFIHHSLTSLRLYRWALGGHWEKWHLRHPCCGHIWNRMRPEDCYRMTGEHPGGLHAGRPRCEEKGKPAYDTAIYCECGRDLSRAPGCAGSYEDEAKEIYSYSCPCGRWPRFHMGPPAPLYLGDVRDDSKAT